MEISSFHVNCLLDSLNLVSYSDFLLIIPNILLGILIKNQTEVLKNSEIVKPNLVLLSLPWNENGLAPQENEREQSFFYSLPSNCHL